MPDSPRRPNALSFVSATIDDAHALNALVGHTLGERRDEATPTRGHTLCEKAHGVYFGAQNIHKPMTKAQRKAALVEFRRPGPKGGRPPKHLGVEFVISGHKVADQHPDDAVRWMKKAWAELKRLHPSARWVAVTAHGDESSWHFHAIAIPFGRDHRGNLRPGCAAMWREAEAILRGGKVRPRALTKKQMAAFGVAKQAHFEAVVGGEKWGMTPQVPGGRDERKEQVALSKIERLAVDANERIHIAEQRERKANARVAAIDERAAAVAERDAAIDEQYNLLSKADAELDAERERLDEQADALQREKARQLVEQRGFELERLRAKKLEGELADERRKTAALTKVARARQAVEDAERDARWTMERAADERTKRDARERQQREEAKRHEGKRLGNIIPLRRGDRKKPGVDDDERGR